MGWGERHAPLIGTGTTGEIDLAQKALAAVGIEKPNLSLAAVEAAGIIDRLREALTAAKVALVPCLTHAFDSCNPGMDTACFTCEGLYAIGKARGEPWCRIDGRTSR